MDIGAKNFWKERSAKLFIENYLNEFKFEDLNFVIWYWRVID